VSNNNEDCNSLYEALNKSMAVCNTVKKAFTIGAWLSEAKEFDHTYRKVADTIREDGIVFISPLSNPEETAIVITKIRKF
jgi:hypothetical protein